MNAKNDEPNTLKYNSAQFIDILNDENKIEVHQAPTISFDLSGSDPVNEQWIL